MKRLFMLKSYRYEILFAFSFLALVAFFVRKWIGSVEIINFPDTYSYIVVKDLIQNGDLIATRTNFRPQTFSFFWYLQEISQLKYQYFFWGVSAISISYFSFVMYSLSKSIGRLSVIVLGLYICSFEHLSWMATKLTESMQFAVILFFFASLVLIERSTNFGTEKIKNKIVIFPFILSVVLLHSLKPWLIIFLFSYLGVRILLFMIYHFKIAKSKTNIISLAALIFLSFLSIAVSKFVYSSGFNRGPGSDNAVALMIRERSDLYLEHLLSTNRIFLTKDRVNELNQNFGIEFKEGIRKCVGNEWVCDVKWAGINQFRKGGEAPLTLLKKIYLGDIYGVVQLSKIVGNRFFRNIYYSESFYMSYGKHGYGNFFFVKSSKLLFFPIIGLVLWICYFLLTAFRKHVNVVSNMNSILTTKHHVIISIGGSGLVMFAFLSLAGAYETGRTEVAALYSLLIFSILFLGLLVDEIYLRVKTKLI